MTALTPRAEHLRKPLVAALAAVAAALALAAVQAAPAAAVPQIAGAQTHLMWSRYDTAAIDRELDRAKAGGVRLVRVDTGWQNLEPSSKGSYSSSYLSKMDTIVSKAEARGIKVLFTFWTTPCWASSAPDDLKQDCTGSWWERGVHLYPPANPQDYADALAYLVARYGNRVAAWEVWNEPNLSSYFKAPDPVSAYAAMLKAAYPAAKAANPSTTVVGGALAWADYAWTDAAYGAGVKGHFDAWSIHPYSDDRSPLDPGSDQWIQVSFIRGVPKVRETMLARGDDKPVWLTEFGWSTCNVRNQEPWRNCVDEPVQAQWLLDAYNQMRSWHYVPVGVWFNFQNTSSDISSHIGNYGLLRYDGSEKPSYGAFRTAANALASDQPVPGANSAAGPPPPPPPSSSEPVGPGKSRKGGGPKKTKSTLSVSDGSATATTLRVRRLRARSKRLRARGRVQGIRAGRVQVRVERYRRVRGSRRGKWVRVSTRRTRVNRGGRFAVRLKLRSGSYRARARYRGGTRTSSSRSRTVRFRLR